MYIKIGDIDVELIRKNIKNMHLYVMRPDGKVRITAPTRLAEDKIRAFILSRADWIKLQQKRISEEPISPPLTYSNGETLYIFGEPYTLEVVITKKPDFSFFGDKATLYCKESSSLEQRQRIVENALRKALIARIDQLLPKWEQITELSPSSYQIKKMKTRWGTCNTRTKKIWLNFELVHKKNECIEYVILHELAHLRVSNHGKDFVCVMDYYMPRWRELKQELNKKQLSLR